MDIPVASDNRWQKAINGERAFEFDFLGTKIIVGRLAVTYKLDPQPATMDKCIGELINFFERNQHMPKAQTDLAKIIV